MTKTCPTCGKVWEVMGTDKDRKYCSIRCANEGHKKDYQRKLLKTEDRLRYDIWREAVIERDGFRCAMEGPDCDPVLVAHHIQDWATYPELRYAPENGIILCLKHHAEQHPRQSGLILGMPVRKEKPQKTCDYCGVLFTPGQKIQRFCGTKCYWLSKNKQIAKLCEVCGQEIKVSPSGFERRRFCSVSCKSRSRKIASTKNIVCAQCGKVVEKRGGHIGHFCSASCWRKYRTGKPRETKFSGAKFYA